MVMKQKDFAGNEFACRESLIAYLEYALEDVTACNKASAAYLVMAIAYLEDSSEPYPEQPLVKYS